MGLRKMLSLPLGVQLGVLLCAHQAQAGPELTWKNWEKRTTDKPVFVLFTSTGSDCPSFCKEIEETWAKLMEVWDDDDHDHAVVGMVDCSGKGKKICQKMELIGKIPNMRHGWGGKDALKPGGLKGYAGSRMEDSLKEWADTHLVKGLTPGEDFVPDGKGQPASRKMSAADVEKLKSSASASFTPEQYEAIMGKGGSSDDILKAAQAQAGNKDSKSKRRRSRRGKGDHTEL